MNRSSFIGSSVLGASGMLLSPALAAEADAQAIPGGTTFVERKANFDEAAFVRTVGRPAEYRFLWEAVAYIPSFLNNVKNGINGAQFGFGADPSQINSVVGGHGPSSSYTYADYVWQKYRIGEFFSIKNAATGDNMATNTFFAKRATSTSTDPDDEHGPYQDTSVEALQSRGVTFMTCHTAVEEQARNLVKRGFAPAGMTPADVANDILTHLVPGALVVPSMVATIGVIQLRYHYAYLNVG